MASLSPPAPLLCVLLWVSVAPQRSDMRLAYVTHDSFYYYACGEEPQACSAASLASCRCKAIPAPYSSPVFRMRRLTVWYTSPRNAARLLNNSEVHHLTLMDCGGAAEEGGAEGYFAVQHLERLSVASAEAESDNALRFEAGGRRWRDATREAPRERHVLLGRERAAAYQEQARLGVIHASVLRGGAAAGVKVYTVQTHIDADGALPFPDLRLPKLPQTAVIYVSFVYRREESTHAL
ncbi:uncharacterized protein LOC144084340 [Stigmatopora argus]